MLMSRAAVARVQRWSVATAGHRAVHSLRATDPPGRDSLRELGSIIENGHSTPEHCQSQRYSVEVAPCTSLALTVAWPGRTSR
ncbi:hypothetical protein DOTSEDRAFT_70068 [Dothistroma septosporum NZE10]|uniref:Uncharacterized protein n=1 Tax=Dothistroma septosporum (strain NZE10 / CBS 128990) TaxID=675120 RepID=N1PSL8_DOTSN|nr:hypothetical protein DOTSEDRAFT_70068 [Dothistroma septosporum NZE10]